MVWPPLVNEYRHLYEQLAHAGEMLKVMCGVAACPQRWTLETHQCPGSLQSILLENITVRLTNLGISF